MSGGSASVPDGRQVYEEGIYVPIMKLFEAGAINRSLIDIVRANVREPDLLEGDFYSLASCNDTGCRRLLDMMAEFSLDSLDQLGEHVIGRSRDAMLTEIRALPFGTYQYAMHIDGYEDPGRYCRGDDHRRDRDRC